MNLVESMVFVLKNKHQGILRSFVKDDTKVVLHKTKQGILTVKDSVKSHFQSIPRKGFKTVLKEFKGFSLESLFILHQFPRRINSGFKIFKDDFLQELEKQPDQIQKTIFCLKVIGALSSFALGTYAGMAPTGRKGFSAKGVTGLLKRELILKLSQLLIIRFLNEIEKVLTHPEDLRTVNYFRSILTDENKDIDPAFHVENEDESVLIVEKLKNYILYGESEAI